MNTKYSKEQIEAKVNIAIDLLVKNDSFLLKNDVNERSISHKLAEYLQQQFPEYNVDCEYNRQYDKKKEIHFSDKKTQKYFLKRKKRKDFLEDKNATTVYPDIIVHERGSKNNLLAIEIKKHNNREKFTIKKDLLKLKKYKLELKYQYCLFLEFDDSKLRHKKCI